MTDQHYPDWQTSIRAAQTARHAEQEQLERANNEKRIRVETKRKALRARYFRFVMSLLGVDIPQTVDDDTVTLDGITFSLQAYRSSARHFDQDIYGFVYPENPDSVGFTLHVSRPVEMTDEENERWFRWLNMESTWRNVQAHDQKTDDDWTFWRAELADAIDYVNTGHAMMSEQLSQLRADYAEKLAREAERKEQPSSVIEPKIAPRQPTLEEQFFVLFKQLVRKYQYDPSDELDFYHGSQEDFGY